MSNLKILITGSSGTGKSTIFKELRERGLNALDADDRALELCSWVEIATSKNMGRGYPEDFSVEKYDWRWDEVALHRILESRESVFLCGNANNATDFYHLFDRVFVLSLPETIQRARIMSRTQHDFGQDSHTQDIVIERQAQLLETASHLGAIVIDATPAPELIVDKVLSWAE